MEFLEQLVKWIVVCKTTPKFSVSLMEDLLVSLEGKGNKAGTPSFSLPLCCIFGPEVYIKKISQICTSFFSKGRDYVAYGVRVCWQLICSPKREGGLGLRNLEEWNKACILPQVGRILAQKDSIWIAWIKEYVMKGKSFWDVAPYFASNWNWRRMLKLKELIAYNV
ncbi:LINE-1 reverse transcriptase-like protein [Gossypium australe]|uniref:LINE-1 reverse transcriptase-like protein n=1 Tax=Gossypium australe TaxID=47621 RepID=A0A5B6X9I0_9ROSI|nr:LINE-1 reverse transcriptase-like protein [Gossypium australe]